MSRLAAAALVVLSLGPVGTAAAAANPLPAILETHPGLCAVVREAPRHRLQVVLGLVEEGASGPRLVQHGFRLDAEYFYPASTVKLFAAVAALERLAELRRETGLAIDADTPLVFHPLFADEELEETDPENVESGRITVRQEIRRIFLVSDNRAFNRLYELVGQDALAASLERAGLGSAWIVHRLSEARSEVENRRFPRIDLVGDRFRHTLPERRARPLPPPPPIRGIEEGEAYLSGGKRVEGPMDFAQKNRISLADLQRGLCMVVRPEIDCGGAGFGLSAEDRALLLAAMTEFPGESVNPVYPAADHPDEHVKLILPGVRRVVPAEQVRVLDKTGQAYGFSTENAWVVERGTGRSFFLAATLYTNEDGVLNDDRYEYAEVARPFLADLGEAVARHFWRPETVSARPPCAAPSAGGP